MLPREHITASLQQAQKPALVAFMTAGYPTREGFVDALRAVAETADAVEIGVPFSDPMADGVTIQRASETAIKNGVTLQWIFDSLTAAKGSFGAPLLLMSYLNPLLVYGYERLAEAAAQADVCGFMVPDLPWEECGPLRAALGKYGIALVQFVTPATPAERLGLLCSNSEGFVYAVTKTGITGGATDMPQDLAQYLAGVKAHCELPVCAGFGVRTADHVQLIGAHADGVIVGSALVEVLESQRDPAEFLKALRKPA
jgi:tryptophan synthase alpha chain